jgi:hypothetical protein
MLPRVSNRHSIFQFTMCSMDVVYIEAPRLHREQRLQLIEAVLGEASILSCWEGLDGFAANISDEIRSSEEIRRRQGNDSTAYIDEDSDGEGLPRERLLVLAGSYFWATSQKRNLLNLFQAAEHQCLFKIIVSYEPHNPFQQPAFLHAEIVMSLY